MKIPTIPVISGMESAEHQLYLKATQAWVEEFVVGLNLCPFAPPVIADRRIRYVMSEAKDIDVLYHDLLVELERLAYADPDVTETTVLVHPHVLQDFYLYNDFLDIVDEALEGAGLVGEIQVASFHPEYLFGGEDEDSTSHFTNRSPYPMLHLLREDSLENALRHYPDPDKIPLNNIETMRKLGADKIKAMLADIAASVAVG